MGTVCHSLNSMLRTQQLANCFGILPFSCDVPSNPNIRFAKILSIAADENSAHVQWFHHGQQTILGDFAHPQEVHHQTYSFVHSL